MTTPKLCFSGSQLKSYVETKEKAFWKCNQARLRDTNGPQGIAFHDGMKPLNLKLALLLITMGTVLLMIGVSPYQSAGLGCRTTQDICAQVEAQEATAHFFEFLLYGMALMSIAVIFLIMGRNQAPSPPTSPP